MIDCLRFFGSDTIGKLLEKTVRIRPRQEALVSEDIRLSYRELKEQAEKLAGAFQVLGLGRGDRVAVLLPNGRDAVLSFLACGLLGTVFVPLDIFYRQPELEKILNEFGVSLLIADGSFLSLAISLHRACPKLGHLVFSKPDSPDFPSLPTLLTSGKLADRLPKIRSKTPLLHLFTSGSTGMPKSVLLSHANVIARGRSYWRRFPLSPGDSCYNLAPLFRGAALFSVVIPGLCFGIRIILPAAFRPSLVWQEMREEKTRIFHANPFHFAVLANLPETGENPIPLKLCFSSGNRLPSKIAEKFYRRFGIFIEERYGTVEAGGISVNGFPRKGVRIRIIDEKGKRIRETDRPGEILVRAPMMAKKYHNSPELSRSIFRGGWFHSGDMGMRDALGRIRILHRKKTMVRIEGKEVYPDAIRDIICSHPKVKTAMVIRNGSESLKLKACVLLKESGTAEEILDFCKMRMDEREIPVIEIRESLPRSWKAVVEGAGQSYPVWGEF